MRLSREKIQRMVGRTGGGTIVGGSDGGGGGVSQGWVDGNYVSKDFFNQLFTVHVRIHTVVTDENDEIISDDTTTSVLPPNDIPSDSTETDEETGYTTTTTVTISDLQVIPGIWTNYFVSALGLNSSGGGGGGGDTLAEPLASINLANLGMPTQAGQLIVWNGTQWTWGTMPSLSGYLPLTGGRMTGSIYMGAARAGASPFIYWGDGSYVYIGEDRDDHMAINADNGVNVSTNDDDTFTWNNEVVATQPWVAGYLSNRLGSYLPLAGGTMTGQILRSSGGAWYEGREKAMIRQTGGVSAAWSPVLSAKTLNGSWELGTISDGDWLANRLVLSYVADSDYNQGNNRATHLVRFPAATGTIALVEDTVAAANRLAGTSAYTVWGQTWWQNGVPAGNVSGSMYDVDSIYMRGSIHGVQGIELNNNAASHGTVHGGVIDFHYGGSTADYTSRIYEDSYGRLSINGNLYSTLGGSVLVDTALHVTGNVNVTSRYIFLNYGNSGLYFEGYGYGNNPAYGCIGWHNASGNGVLTFMSFHYQHPTYGSDVLVESGKLTIGNVSLVYDSQNNAIRIVTRDGSAANLYATGSVSALGMSPGTSSVDSMRFNYLTAATRLYVGTTASYLYRDSGGNLVIGSSAGIVLNSRTTIGADGAPGIVDNASHSILSFSVNGQSPSVTLFSASSGSAAYVYVWHNGTRYRLNMQRAIEYGIMQPA